jgi:hypothetical protein
MGKMVLVIHGKFKAGKTALAHALMRWICEVKGKDQYWYSTNYDSLGYYSRDNGVSAFGGYIFDDCAPKTLMNSRLTVDDWRGIFTLDGGSFSSRYTPAGMARDQYRILLMNSRRNKRTGQLESYFAHFELPACDALLHGDLARFQRIEAVDDAGASIASRGIFFHVTEDLLTKKYLTHLENKTQEETVAAVRDHPIERDTDEEA